MTAVPGTSITYGTPTGGLSVGTGTSHAFNHNSVAGIDTCLVAQITVFRTSGTPITVLCTYNGVSMTSLFETTFSSSILIAMFILPNPATGSNSVSFSWSGGSGYASCVATTFYGVNQNNPYVTGSPTSGTGTGTTASQNIPSMPEGLVVDCAGIANNSYTMTSSQTLILSQAGAGTNGENNQAQALGTGASITMSYTISTSTGWHMGGVCLFPAFSGGGAMISPTMIG